MIELTTEVAHPLDLLLASPYVDGVGVVQLAEALAFNQSVQDTIHLNFCLESLALSPEA